MHTVRLRNSGEVYTCEVYLVLGDWNTLDDVNTLVDVGRDPAVIGGILEAPTGVGKTRIEQVVLTHGHYDHCGLLPEIRQMFRPKVFAFSRGLDGVDCLLRHGDTLKMGDRIFEVIHAPEHSSDSICLYNAMEGVLFAGDTPLLISSVGGSYTEDFVELLEGLCARDIHAIYFGHGDPMPPDCGRRLRASLENVRRSMRTPSAPVAERR